MSEEPPAARGDPDVRDRSATADPQSDERATYVESQVIMTTVRVVAPFTFTYGLFLSFHGGASPGGGFQGGAVVGATVLMLAFAFGIEPTREWLSNRVVAGLVAGGVVAFALIGLLPLLVGGRFLEHGVYGDEFALYHGAKYALEAVEFAGILPIVGAAVVGLFFAIAAGVPGLASGDVERGAPADESEDVVGDGGSAPGDDGRVPGDDGRVPGDDGRVPGDDGRVPGDDGRVPGDDGRVPGDDGRAPANGGPAAARDDDGGGRS